MVDEFESRIVFTKHRFSKKSGAWGYWSNHYVKKMLDMTEDEFYLNRKIERIEKQIEYALEYYRLIDLLKNIWKTKKS